MIFYNYIKENILVPRNLEGRQEKLRQNMIKLLSQKVIECENFIIDESFEGIPEELVKVKGIKGNVYLRIEKGYIPEWLKDVKVHGNFDCTFNDLTSLENCPQYVNGTFNCNNNLLTSLEGGPQYVEYVFTCSHNQLTSLEGCPKYIGGNLYCYNNNKIKLKLPEYVELKGELHNE